MKRAVEDARAAVRAAIVENPRADWEQRERIMIASVRNCILIYAIGVCQAVVGYEMKRLETKSDRAVRLINKSQKRRFISKRI